MDGIYLDRVIHIYTDASDYAAGCAVTKFQANQNGKQDIEVPVLYGSFALTSTQRKYPTYKRELCALVTFCKKYNHMCKHPFRTTIVHIDHGPLTHFLAADLHEGIYGH